MEGKNSLTLPAFIVQWKKRTWDNKITKRAFSRVITGELSLANFHNLLLKNKNNYNIKVGTILWLEKEVKI